MARSTQRFVLGNICSESLKSPEIFLKLAALAIFFVHQSELLPIVADMYYYVSLFTCASCEKQYVEC